MHYLLYTDGAYFPEHEISTIAYVMIQATPKKEVRRLHQTVKGDTSGRAELRAIISAIYALPKDAVSCTIVSDSKYAIDACDKRCIRYKNTDLLNLFDQIVEKRGISVSYSWVKAHNGNFYNELCDSLCQQALKEHLEKLQNQNQNETETLQENS